jgi:CheY-like chemotaxis protein
MRTDNPTRPLTVLIVDDERDAAESLAGVLGLGGHDARVACTPTTAVIEAAARPPDAIIMDIGIPGMDGYRLARRLCEVLPARPLLVALTGYANLEERSREEGFNHHLVKPADPAVLEALLSGHASRAADAEGPPTGR